MSVINDSSVSTKLPLVRTDRQKSTPGHSVVLFCRQLQDEEKVYQASPTLYFLLKLMGAKV